MAALAGPRKRLSREGTTFNRPVKANAQIYQNGMVALLAGVAIAARAGVDAAEAATMAVDGIAAETVRGGALDGAERLDVDRGCFCMANAGDIQADDIGKDCFVVDDQTVSLSHAVNTRPKAGRIEDVTSEGVWVAFGA